MRGFMGGMGVPVGWQLFPAGPGRQPCSRLELQLGGLCPQPEPTQSARGALVWGVLWLGCLQ